jgi:hypothetical protein
MVGRMKALNCWFALVLRCHGAQPSFFVACILGKSLHHGCFMVRPNDSVFSRYACL